MILPKTIASLDIGTNTVTLLIVEIINGKIKVKYENEFITRLGEGISKNGNISSQAIERCKNILNECKSFLDKFKAKDVHSVATSALRRSENQEEVMSVIHGCEFYPEIISGKREAELVGISVIKEFSGILDSAIVIDIGGGSTEFIFIQGRKIVDVKSINIGTVILTEKFISTDPVSEFDRNQIIKYISQQIERINFSRNTIKSLIGVGGTVTTIGAIIKKVEPYDSQKIHKMIFNRDSLELLEKDILYQKLNFRKKIPGLHPLRAEIIPSGCLLLSTIMDLLNFQEITVCDRGLRWGVLWDNI